MRRAIKHPAKFSNAVLVEIASWIPPGSKVLDPFAGTGRVHWLDVPDIYTVGVELEPEWASMAENTLVGNALHLPFRSDTFDVIATSPTWGNRMADHHNARDDSIRHTYTHDLRVSTGDPTRSLHSDNSGTMQWGKEYCYFHCQAWDEVDRVLRPGGRILLNIKDHVRADERQFVSSFHLAYFLSTGYVMTAAIPVETPGLRHGSNADVRCPEYLYVLDKAGFPDYGLYLRY